MKNKLKYFLSIWIFSMGCGPSIYFNSNDYLTDRPSSNEGIYISRFNNYNLEQKDFIAKIGQEFQDNNYLIVNHFLESKYYLLIEFVEYFGFRGDIARNNKNMKIILSFYKSDYVEIPLSDLHKKKIVIWDCKIDLKYMEYLKYQDQIIKTIQSKFFKSYNGKTMLW